MTVPQSTSRIIEFVRSIYGSGNISLHRPVFNGNEKQYLIDCIDSNFVSSVGERVNEFERSIATFTGSNHAVATVNGTAALHIALKLVGVDQDDEVISQPLTFIATCNAISYSGASPIFVDVDRDTMSMSPGALDHFLERNTIYRDHALYNRITGRRISACVPMHTFGLPGRIEEIVELCNKYNLPVVEDAAESLGSYVGERHTGNFGAIACLSFNGNKVITTGGGGMLITNDSSLSQKAKHLTTTAKIPHPYEFVHDMVGYNYRLPNLNAAIGCAQMEHLTQFLEAKAKVARSYQTFFAELGVPFIQSRAGTTSNYWLNAILMNSLEERDQFLRHTNEQGVMTRPIWRLMNHLEMFKSCYCDGLDNATWLEERVVNLPSSVPDHWPTNL